MAESRTVHARKIDVLASLEGQNDLWLATADSSGRPHLKLDGRDVMRNSRWLA